MLASLCRGLPVFFLTLNSQHLHEDPLHSLVPQKIPFIQKSRPLSCGVTGCCNNYKLLSESTRKGSGIEYHDDSFAADADNATVSNPPATTSKTVPLYGQGLGIDDFSVTVPASTLKFRSAATGTWNSNATWEMSTDGTTWVAATQTPTSANDTITVRSPHVVTVAASVDADQLTVDGGGKISVNNGTFTPNNRAVFFTGGNTQTASDASGALTMPYVRINKSGGTLQLNSNLTTLGPNGGDSIQFTGATSTLTLNGKTLMLGSTIGSISTGSGFIGSNSSGMSLQDGGAAGAMGTLVFVGGSESLQNLTMNRTGGAGSVTLGSPLTINGALTLKSGIINMGSNTLTLTNTATAARTAGYVTGNYKKIYSATGNFTYDVGTANGYSPLTANVTNLNGTSDLTVKPTQTAQPQLQTPAKTLQRYWTLTEGGDLTADLTFSYLDPPDVPGTANETAFIVFKYDGSNFTTPTGVVDFINNKFTVPGVSSFSDWTLAEAIVPTAVKLFDFKATSNNGLVRVDWNTGYEAR
ncbi:MAG: hypothetical protein QOD00_4017, partial [Blastocatellia bacterium]|nr:hypothetical protein [Blastocatellia bacterium]